jgi:RNA polymerase sigma factor (sigma-70 family)
MMVNKDEILLWNGLRNGCEDDLHTLYVRYYNDLLRYGLSLTNDPDLAKEYINSIFIDFWNNRHKLTEVDNPKAYVITSYKNKIIFKKKKASDLKTVDLSDYNHLSEPSATIEETLIELQEYERLQQKVNSILISLTERQRQLVVLRFIEEKSYQEIADQLNISTRTVYNSIHESLKLMRLHNQ